MSILKIALPAKATYKELQVANLVFYAVS